MKQTATFFASPVAFRRWLERHAATESELIVGFWKVGTGRPSQAFARRKQPATRARRLARIIDACGEGRRLR